MDIIKSGIMPINGKAYSMKGGRPENQDDWGFIDTPLGFLLIVCDGMGGGPGGKTASYLAKNEIMKVLFECDAQTPRSHAVKMAVAKAQEVLEKKMTEIPQLSGMGSTFVAVLINSESAIIAHAGDSRCYRFSGIWNCFRTKDHSLVSELVSKKALTEEQARVSPQANVITRGLGNVRNNVPDIQEVPFRKGDRFILCTDGVWGAMRHSKLMKRFRKKDMSSMINSLSSEIENIGFAKGGHHDNHTLAVIEVGTNSLMKDKTSLSKIAIISFTFLVMSGIIALCIWLIMPKGDEPITTTSYTPIPMNISSSVSSNVSTISIADIETEASTSKQFADEQNSGTEIKENHERDEVKENEKDHTQKTETSGVLKSKVAETIQKAINRYGSAKSVEGKTEKEASMKLDSLRKEIKSLLNQLSEIVKEMNIEPQVNEISNAVDAQNSWFVAKEGELFKPTITAKKQIDKQIERLTDLKKQILKVE